MSSLPVAVLVSGEGTNLQALIDGPHARGTIRIVAVASDRPQIAALDRASAAGIETASFQVSDFPDRTERDAALAGWLEERGADLVVSAGYMQLLDASFVDRFRGRLINVHPSLLPAFPGMDAIGQAFEAGVSETGVTVHFVDEGVDTGAVIASRPVDVEAGMTLEELTKSVHRAEHDLLPEVVEGIALGEIASSVDPITSGE